MSNPAFMKRYKETRLRVDDFLRYKLALDAWRGPSEKKGELTEEEMSRIGADVASIPLEWRDVRPSEGQKFLEALAPDDSAFCLYSVDNVVENGIKREHEDLTYSFDSGNLRANWRDLAKLNDQGAGIYVTVQRMDGRGRKKANVERIRAVFVDLDGSPLDKVRDCPLKPHLIVETSPGRYHAFWRVNDLLVEDYQGIALAAAERFGGDPAVAILTAGARLPGFYHTKGIPFRVQIIERNDAKPYSADQIVAEFPPIARTKKPPASVGVTLNSRAPLEVAKAFLRQNYVSEEHNAVLLVHHRGEIYRWTGTHYTPFGDDNLRERLYDFLGDAWVETKTKKGEVEWRRFDPTRAKVSEVRDALAAGVNQDQHCDAPFYIVPSAAPDGRDLTIDGSQIIAARNGLLDLRTRTFEAHTPFFFTTSSLPFNYDPDAPKPRLWFRFLKQLWPDDRVARRCLQEIFGLALTADTSFQKLFLLVGPKRSGKGTIARVMRAMLGDDAVAAPTLRSLAGDFGLEPLINKRVAIIGDARPGGGDASTMAERLLSISGEDAIGVNRKHKPFWNGRLLTRFVILTNELPQVKDASGALASRFVILTLASSFYGREDPKLTEKLMPELPGILNWSLRGLDRLVERGRFQMPQSSSSAIRQLEHLSSPISAFVDECCVVCKSGEIQKAELYIAWQDWCERNGVRPSANNVFGKDLLAAQPSIQSTSSSGAYAVYRGIALRQDYEG